MFGPSLSIGRRIAIAIKKEESEMKVNGQCYCGDVTYVAEVDESKVVSCHCTDCQHVSSGPFRTAVMSLPNALTFTGKPATEYVKTAASGNQRAQGFCGVCGSTLYATSVGEGDKIYALRIGAIKEHASLKPKAQIWCQSATPWLKSLSDIPAFETTPNA